MGMPTRSAVPAMGLAAGPDDKYGVLTVKVMRGMELKSAAFMGKCDPFCRLTLGTQQVFTKVHSNGGKNPLWGDSFDFKVLNEKTLCLEVLDKEVTGPDKPIGKMEVTILDWLAKGSFDGNIDILDSNQAPAGKINLSVKFQRPNSSLIPPPPLNKPAPPKLGTGAEAGSADGKEGGAGKKEGGARSAEEARDPNGAFTDQEIKEAFLAFDLDHNNFVGAAEIRHVLINIGEQVTDEEVDEMIRMVDTDGDGQVAFDEFYEMITGKKPPPGLYDGPGSGSAGGAAGSAPPPPPGGVSTRPQGGGNSVIAERNERKELLEAFARENSIKPESVKKAFKRFQAIDKDQSGMIDYTEFCEVIQVDPSPAIEKVFQNFDKDKVGQVDIREFFISLSNFTGASKEEKLKFAFMVFDEDGNGVITKQELTKILKANHMASSEKEVARKADTIMAQADKDGDGVVSFEEFVGISKRFPNLTFPAISSSPPT